VARGELFDDDHFYRGKTSSGAWARTFPKQVEPSDELMQRGNQRFGIYCTPCHGQLGDGNGMITQRAQDIGQVWVPPTNIADERLHRQPVGQLFNTVSRGLRNMPAYGAQIEPMDRWAIVMYVRALQRSRHANLSDLPEADRASLK
jgi:mono/diheme cytochrome c family protein